MKGNGVEMDPFKHAFHLVGLVLLVAMICACGEKKEPAETASAPKVSEAAEASDPAKTEKKAAEVATEGPKPVKPQVVKLSASHILVMHNESKRKPPTINRTKEEAKKRIDEIAAKLKKGGNFAEIAKEYSDCPSGKQKGGDLGIFPSNRMAPEFSEGTMAIGVGEISAPVESPFGYHIIKRQAVEEVHARHILLMHTESTRRPPSVTRTKSEAKTQIEELAKKLKAGESFETLAKAHSDCPSKRRGGDLGTFGKGQMAPPFEKTAFALAENEISDIVETDFGYHIIERLP
ncbi:MAG: peptidylprolyl isomerase [Myxococcota bacterium]|nr:peptidylprolyl isomerase [Myxococcota bacterium]